MRVVVLRAEGRGFNAGVDIKEMQDTEGFDALIGANKGCYAAFAAVYECAVPVDRRGQRLLPRRRHRPGRQRRRRSSPADDASFGLPEVDRGALGAATHLGRLVPQHKMRAMVYLRRPPPRELQPVRARCSRWSPRGRAARRGLQGRRARSPPSRPTVIRAAKEASTASTSGT